MILDMGLGLLNIIKLIDFPIDFMNYTCFELMNLNVWGAWAY